MAGDEERLVVLLEAKVRDLEKNMAKASGITAKTYRQMSLGSKSATRNMERDMTRATTRINQALATTSSKIGAFARSYVGTLAAVVGAGALGRAFVEKTIAQQEAVEQLEAVLKSTGGVAGVTAQAGQDLAASLQKVTTYGDEAIIPAESILLTFTKIGKDVFPTATETVLDMATALHTDLKSAALQVGKALNDPITQMTYLRKSGVSFSQAQQDVIKNLAKTGHLAQAQALILQELQKEFGGSARAARDTLGGALKSLGNAWGDLFELSGPVVDNFQSQIEDLTDSISDPTTRRAFATLGETMFAAFREGVDGLRQLQTAIDNFSASPVPAEIGKITGALAEARDTFYEFARQLGQATGAENVGAAVAGSSIGQALGLKSSKLLRERMAGEPTPTPEALRDYIAKNYPSSGRKPLETTATKPAGTTAPPATPPRPSARSSGGGSSRSHSDSYQRETEQIERRTNTLTALNQVQAGLNPLIDDYGYAIEKARAKQQLLNAAESAGKEITPELEATIEGLAGKYAEASAKAGKLADAHREAVDAIAERKDLVRGALGDITSALEDGKITMQEWGQIATNVLDKVISKIEDELVNALFDAGQAGGGGGGLIGSIIGGIGSLFGGASDPWAGLRGNANGTDNWIGGPTRINERGGEIMDLPRGTRIIPHDVSMAMANQGGGGGHTVVQIIDQRRSGTVDRQETKGPNGETQVRLIVRDELASYRNSQAMTQDVGRHYSKAKTDRYIR